MRSSDWSSDVCSSDLAVVGLLEAVALDHRAHRAVDHEDAFGERGFERGDAVGVEPGKLFHGFTPKCLACLLPLQGEGRDGDGFCLGWRETHPHPTLTLKGRSEEHTSELQSLMRISYAVFCLKKNTKPNIY